MHRTAHAPVQTGIAREDLAVGAIYQEPAGQGLHRPAVTFLHRSEDGAVQVRPHDPQQLRVAHLPDRGEALGQNLAMAAVRAVDVVVGRQRVGHSDGRRFLAHRKMSRAPMVVGDPFVGSLKLDFVDDRFELANGAHILEYVGEILERVSREFLFNGLVVSVDFYVREMNAVPGEHNIRFYDNRLRHFL